MVKVSIIIPFLNEEENIPLLTESLNSFFSSIKSFEAEIIFVNDGSTDNSISILKQQNHNSYSSKLISFSKNFGSHAALRAGITYSTGDYITFIYADLQDPLSLITEMFDKIHQQDRCDIVWATRKSTESGLLESTFSKIYASLMKKYVSVLYPSKGFDIVMFSKKVSTILNQNIENNSSIFLQILTLGFKQDFVVYDKKPRIKGKSKWTFSKKMKLFIDSFVAFSYAPIRFVSFLGIIFFVFGLVWTVYIITRKLIYDDLVSGWPAITSILLLGFGITNIGLGIIAEYLWRTLDVSRKRPVFIVNEVHELNSKNLVS
jgi:dolichol-phosphate mannosyltransferase